jgi:hypothetical protein
MTELNHLVQWSKRMGAMAVSMVDEKDVKGKKRKGKSRDPTNSTAAKNAPSQQPDFEI